MMRTEKLTEEQIQAVVDKYLADVLGSEYTGDMPTRSYERLSFLIQCNRPDVNQPCMVGRVSVNADGVMPLSDEQIREIRECTAWEAARIRGKLARAADGYLLRHQARRLASQWLDTEISMKFGATGGVFIPLDPPVWQFSISFDLQNVHLEPLGVVDVNALTGDVTPLGDHQIKIIQEKAHAVIQHSELAPTAWGRLSGRLCRDGTRLCRDST